jgi:hypothetical protein
LRQNQIDALPSQIGNLAKLSYLNLHSNKLTSTSIPPEFANLTSLESLGIYNNLLTNLPSPISELTQLKQINLGWNSPLESLAGIGNMTALEELYLHSTGLTDLPEEMANLTHLKTLWLTGNAFTNFPSVLLQLTGLETLLLTYNPQMIDQLPLSLVGLTRMKEFAFDGTQLCVPADATLLSWLAGVTTVTSSGLGCDSDEDNIADAWEIEHFGDLQIADAITDWDGDGYSDLQEYLNRDILDDEGNLYDPKVKNAPGGLGYSPVNRFFLPAILMLLL